MFGIFIIIGIIALVIYNGNLNAKKKAQIKQRYELALKGADKRAALDAGRAYYSSIRKAKILTMYDEQAITNDLNAMG